MYFSAEYSARSQQVHCRREADKICPTAILCEKMQWLQKDKITVKYCQDIMLDNTIRLSYFRLYTQHTESRYFSNRPRT